MKRKSSSVDNDVLSTYYKQVSKLPLLTGAEERSLAQRVAEGDEAAKHRLVECNLRLVVKIARGFRTPDVPLLDLIQEGNIGLMTAVVRFDGEREVRFSTYAAWWIKQAISRSLANRRRLVRIPPPQGGALSPLG